MLFLILPHINQGIFAFMMPIQYPKAYMYRSVAFKQHAVT